MPVSAVAEQPVLVVGTLTSVTWDAGVALYVNSGRAL